MIAIHKSIGFSERWITYCQENDIPYKIVNAYDSDIIDQVVGCAFFMWHISHFSYKDMLIARQVLYSLQSIGVRVYPDFNTAWHFDDKVGQKYLLEAYRAPLIRSYVFLNRREALSWIDTTSFPKVFKLRGGAGASNVKLVDSKKAARYLINKSFSKGFKYYDSKVYFIESFRKYLRKRATLVELLKSFVRLFKLPEFARMYSREKGYVYFQDFVPDNKFDIRVVVVGNKAVAEKRFVRKNDFRASGSGEFTYSGINEDVIRIAFTISEKMKMQSAAFDFVYTQDNQPLIVEISYAFGLQGISKAPGFWTNDLKWHNSNDIDLCGWMVESLIAKI